MYVIYRPEGLHQENLCPRSRMYGPRPQAEVSAFKTEGKVSLDKDRPRPVSNLFIPPLKFALKVLAFKTNTERAR